MILSSPGCRLTLLRVNCTKLFQQHRKEKSESLYLDKIRIQRRALRLAWRSQFGPTSHEINGRTLSELSSRNTRQISDSPRQITVILQDGRTAEFFSGTPYRAFNQVLLFLATGQSGDSLRTKSSLDLMREAASSSYVSAMLRTRTLMEKSTSGRTASSTPAIRVHEEIAQAKARSLVVDRLVQPTHGFENWDVR